MTRPQMQSYKYVGRSKQLAGCTALGRINARGDFEVQFDYTNAREASDIKLHPYPSKMEHLMFGWHKMPKKAFELIERNEK